MESFLKWIEEESNKGKDEKSRKSKDENIPTLISLVIEIAYRNPRVQHIAINILTFLLEQLEAKDEKATLEAIVNRFKQMPNSDLLQVWLQRLSIKVKKDISYDVGLCKTVQEMLKEEPHDNSKIWNTKWLKESKLKKIVKTTEIVNRKKLEDLKPVATKEERKEVMNRSYVY